METYKVIGKTYTRNENDTSRRFWTFEDHTVDVIKHYWPILSERIKELLEEDKINLLWKFEEAGGAPKHTKFNFTFSVYNDGEYGMDWLMGFSMNESGNCCGSMFFHGIELDRGHMQQEGLGKLLLAMIEDIATVQNVYNLLCINVEGRNFNYHLLKRGFKVIDSFENDNSDNCCEIYSKKLKGKFEERDIEVVS